jgi:hypothetical protein
VRYATSPCGGLAARDRGGLDRERYVVFAAGAGPEGPYRRAARGELAGGGPPRPEQVCEVDAAPRPRSGRRDPGPLEGERRAELARPTRRALPSTWWSPAPRRRPRARWSPSTRSNVDHAAEPEPALVARRCGHRSRGGALRHHSWARGRRGGELLPGDPITLLRWPQVREWGRERLRARSRGVWRGSALVPDGSRGSWAPPRLRRPTPRSWRARLDAPLLEAPVPAPARLSTHSQGSAPRHGPNLAPRRARGCSWVGLAGTCTKRSLNEGDACVSPPRARRFRRPRERPPCAPTSAILRLVPRVDREEFLNVGASCLPRAACARSSRSTPRGSRLAYKAAAGAGPAPPGGGLADQ